MRDHAGAMTVELVVLVAVTVVIGLLVKFVAYRDADDVHCSLVLLPGAAPVSCGG